MADGRALVVPQILAFGACPVVVPGRGRVLCVSAALPFRLSDGVTLRGEQWYEAVARSAGPTAVPDTLAPLPGAEVLVLGPVAAVHGDAREASLHCGDVARRLLLRPDPDTPDVAPVLGPDTAVWHEHDNPVGRGGPGDPRSPLIVDADAPDRPFWLGPTPFDHPARQRRVGTPTPGSGAGWPPDAQPSALHEAHPGLWTQALHPGDRLRMHGLSREDVDLGLPPYRIVLASCRMPDAQWRMEIVRIHCVTLLPIAGLGAVIWRAAIALGNDVLGESVFALVAALEDVDAPDRDVDALSDIAVARWQDPLQAMDDRPLLPAALASTVALPFATREGPDPIADRQAAAERWIREETGLPEDFNPFAREDDIAAQLEEKTVGAQAQPDVGALDEMAASALSDARRRHAKAGFHPPDAEAMRKPVARGHALESEIETRLTRPFQSPRERALVSSLSHAERLHGVDPMQTLERLTEARRMAIEPMLGWPPLPREEAIVFGTRLMARLRQSAPFAHLDVAGAIVGESAEGPAAEADPDDTPCIADHVLDRCLAEQTVWHGVEFDRCVVRDTTFAESRFEHCVFRDCTFESVNFSRVTFDEVLFVRCTFEGTTSTATTWLRCRYTDCTWQTLSFVEPALRETAFSGGAWRQVQMTEGLMVDVELRDMRLDEVTCSAMHAPNTTFEAVVMHKVWVLSKGFMLSTFRGVEADTCGFLSSAHFDGTCFERSRFVRTGFTNASFARSRLDAACLFVQCDFSGAVFQETSLSAVRFLECSMARTRWHGVHADAAWFKGSILRGVDFGDTLLTGAVFADADIDGLTFQEDKVIGADFRGTVLGVD